MIAIANPITPVYTKLNGKLACYFVETTDVEEARQVVQGAMSVRHRTPVLAVITGSPTQKNIEKSVD